jgi:hypothetical protein
MALAAAGWNFRRDDVESIFRNYHHTFGWRCDASSHTDISSITR